MFTNIITVLASAGLVSAANLQVENHCDFDTNVALHFHGADAPAGLVKAGQSFMGEIPLFDNATQAEGKYPLWMISGDRDDPKGSQILYAFVYESRKGTGEAAGLFAEYSISEGQGHPFAGHTVGIAGADELCDSVFWPEGVTLDDSGANAGLCRKPNTDVVLSLCGTQM